MSPKLRIKLFGASSDNFRLFSPVSVSSLAGCLMLVMNRRRAGHSMAQLLCIGYTHQRGGEYITASLNLV